MPTVAPMCPLLALPWYEDKVPLPPPPPTPTESPIHLVVETRAHRGRCPKTMGPQRNNTRLKEKEPEVFVLVATKAVQRKALRESLAACSATQKK